MPPGTPHFRKVQFQGAEYGLDFSRYQNGRPALILEDRDGNLAAMATVNIPEVQLKPNQVLIKDYSENHGMLRALEDAGIVKATGQSIRSGFADLPVCDLLIHPPTVTGAGMREAFEKTVESKATDTQAIDYARVFFGEGRIPTHQQQRQKTKDKGIER
jgi:hypothetical protein